MEKTENVFFALVAEGDSLWKTGLGARASRPLVDKREPRLVINHHSPGSGISRFAPTARLYRQQRRQDSKQMGQEIGEAV